MTDFDIGVAVCLCMLFVCLSVHHSVDTQNRQDQRNKTTTLTKIIKNKCFEFIEFARLLCSAVALLSFPGPRGRYNSGGGLNVPVRMTVALPKRDALKKRENLFNEA